MTAGLGHVNIVDGDSVNAVGSQTTPSAGLAIATIAAAALPKGKYRVSCFPAFGGTAGTVNDMQLKKGATVVGSLSVQAAVNTPAARASISPSSLQRSSPTNKPSRVPEPMGHVLHAGGNALLAPGFFLSLDRVRSR